MCYHLGLAKAVLFGGHDGANFTDSTWTYNGTTWTQVAIPGSKPSPRSSAAMVYDSVRNICVLHGGQNATGPLADTWTFDGATWTQQPFVTQAGRDQALAFLPSTNQTVRFGGFVAAPNTLSNQTWAFGSGVYGQGCAGSNGVPALVAAGAPQIGQNFTLNLTNLNPAFSLGFLALGFTPLPGIDLGPILGMPGCAAFASPDVLLTVSGAAGAANFVWAPVAGPLGAAFFCQCVCLDPGANAAGLTISNATFATIAN
jgi:hypothetical protein